MARRSSVFECRCFSTVFVVLSLMLPYSVGPAFGETEKVDGLAKGRGSGLLASPQSEPVSVGDAVLQRVGLTSPLASGVSARSEGGESAEKKQSAANSSSQCLPEPTILFVPGFTGALAGTRSEKMKAEYFKSQKRFLFQNKGRDVIDMNNRQGFDSDNSAITCNAEAIAGFLERLNAPEPMEQCPKNFKQVTIVSHSKGGQDVLEALINHPELWTPDELCGNPPTVRGWVAFTTNFFESEFQIEGGGADKCNIRPDPTPPMCGPNGMDCTDQDFPEPCPNGDNAESLYADFPKSDAAKLDFLQPDLFDSVSVARRKARSRNRIDYMHDNQDKIEALLTSVPTQSLWASYVPQFVRTGRIGRTENGNLNRFNRGIRQEAIRNDLDGANDGVVPARAAQLPGVSRKLRDDPATKRCGVDHLGPADLNDAFDEPRAFWTEALRNTYTWNRILEVEAQCEEKQSIEVEIDTKPGSDPNSINCRHNGVIPVAVLTTNTTSGDQADFDATTVDSSTVRFGPDGATRTHRTHHIRDVDGDGDEDMLLHFRQRSTGIQCGDVEACLSGETIDGMPIEGCDGIRTVGNR